MTNITVNNNIMMIGRGDTLACQMSLVAGDIINILAVSDDFDPVVLIFDEEGNLLAANEYLADDGTDAGFEELEIPRDLSLVLWVASQNEENEGAFTISVIDAGG